MKKILYPILALGLTLTSCDMDVKVPGQLDQKDAIQDLVGLEGFRYQTYNVLRSVTTGSWVTNPDLQADYYVGLRGNGGRSSRQIQASYTASSSEVTGFYQSAYSSLKHINFAIVEGQKLIDNGVVSGDDALTAQLYVGEMKFTRAYLYYYLLDHYCQAYGTVPTDQEGYGLQLVTIYDPGVPSSQYPGRSSIDAALALINGDLTDAYTAVKAYEAVDDSALAPNAAYLNSATVRALQARVALYAHDWANAYNYAKEVIDCPEFELASGEDYIDMWSTDSSSELLFVPFADQSESANTTSLFNAYNYVSDFSTDGGGRVNCIPTMNWLEAYVDESYAYDATGNLVSNPNGQYDNRFDAFFDGAIFTVEAQYTGAYYLNKYPGNATLNTSAANSYKNKAKPFRLSEQYLIAAEAAYENGQPELALTALNDLRAKRIDNCVELNLSGNNLRDAIRQERAIELIGEGFRLSDLKRWGLGFDKSVNNYYGLLAAGTVDVSTLFVSNDINVKYNPYDYRYTWPIPYDEIQVAPALAGQQNPNW